jgi:hypothetical protein
MQRGAWPILQKELPLLQSSCCAARCQDASDIGGRGALGEAAGA